MNTCQNCGGGISDKDTHCASCEAKIKAENTTDFPGAAFFQSGVRLSSAIKWYCWCGAWLLVIILTCKTNPENILGAPFFPIGLLAWLPDGEDTAIEAYMLGGWVIGWMFYIVFSVIMFRTRKAGIFFIMFVIFVTLLMLDVAGCQRVLEATAQIH